MKAISFNNYDCVRVLLRFGADPTIPNNVNYIKIYLKKKTIFVQDI